MGEFKCISLIEIKDMVSYHDAFRLGKEFLQVAVTDFLPKLDD